MLGLSRDMIGLCYQVLLYTVRLAASSHVKISISAKMKNQNFRPD